MVTKQILQLNFFLGVTDEEWKKTAEELAGSFAEVPGLNWKVWIMNEARHEAGGIYLFEDESSTEAFLQSELAEAVKNHPAVKDMDVKQFDCLEEPSRTTRGPL